MRAWLVALAAVPLLGIGPCAAWEIAAGIAGTTAAGSYVPAQELEQVYYLGSFDPRGQLAPEFYRLTVRGQASLISRMRFGSGWVPAGVIDSLTSGASFGDDGKIALAQGAPETRVTLQTGRRLMLFGPEGFREAPREHRLAIVMGSDPEAFFNAIDRSLGTISGVQRLQRKSAVSSQLFAEHIRLAGQLTRLEQLETKLATQIPLPEPASE